MLRKFIAEYLVFGLVSLFLAIYLAGYLSKSGDIFDNAMLLWVGLFVFGIVAHALIQSGSEEYKSSKKPDS